MSAKVTEAHERKAQELWSENSGSAWLQDGVITPKLIPAIAQALADAEQAEREAITQIAKGLYCSAQGDNARRALFALLDTIRARGQS